MTHHLPASSLGFSMARPSRTRTRRLPWLSLGLSLALAYAIPWSVGRAADVPLAVDYGLDLVSGNAIETPERNWNVQAGERIEWRVTWKVVNTSGEVLPRLQLANNYSAETDVIENSVDASRGDVLVEKRGGANSATAVLWAIGDLPPGGSAELTFHIATGTNPQGKQQYAEPGAYCLDSALTVKWKGGSFSFPCVPVHARELPWMRIEVDGTRKDWRVRKPGDYASPALQFQVASNADVQVRFEGFADLMPMGSPQSGSSGVLPIPASYAAGSTLEEADAAGWWRAQQLNEQVVLFRESDALKAGVSWGLWQRLTVSPEHPPAEYEDTARVIFVLGNLSQAVVGGRSANS